MNKSYGLLQVFDTFNVEIARYSAASFDKRWIKHYITENEKEIKRVYPRARYVKHFDFTAEES